MQLSETPSQADEFSRIDAPPRYRNITRIVFSPRPEKKNIRLSSANTEHLMSLK